MLAYQWGFFSHLYNVSVQCSPIKKQFCKAWAGVGKNSSDKTRPVERELEEAVKVHLSNLMIRFTLKILVNKSSKLDTKTSITTSTTTSITS